MSVTRFSLACLSLAALSLTGCPEETNCTTLAAVSVTVTVSDMNGAALPEDANLSVSYQSGGGAEIACDPLPDNAWACGYEVEGDLLITASAERYVDGSQTVTVNADECHVQGEALDLTLEPEARNAFEEDRTYLHALFTTQAECEDAQAQGVNCFEAVELCADGSATIMLTDILVPGSYALDGDAIDCAWGSGDVPSELSFTRISDDEIEDDTWGNPWIRTLDPLEILGMCP